MNKKPFFTSDLTLSDGCWVVGYIVMLMVIVPSGFLGLSQLFTIVMPPDLAMIMAFIVVVYFLYEVNPFEIESSDEQ